MTKEHEIYDRPLQTVLEDAEQPGNVIDYQPGTTIVHRLNPVTKLVISLCLIAIAFLMPDFRGPMIIAVSLFAIAILTRVYRPITKIVVITGTPLALALIVIQGLFFPDNVTPYYIIEPVPIVDQIIFYEEGLLFALLFLFRILTLMITLLLVIVTTHPKRLTIALEDKGLSNKFAYVFLSALQLIPEMQNRAKAIVDAQQARGLDTKANIRKRLKSVLALFIPLMIGMLIAAETRALALESRGFTRTGDRTSLFHVPDTLLDRGLRWAGVGAVFVIAIWRFLL